MPGLEELVGAHPAPRRVSDADVRLAMSGQHQVLVVLDDDPTGTQSVAELPVLTAWSGDDFRWAFGTGAAAVYVMTNSRSLAPDEAARVTREVVECAAAVSEECGLRPVFVSRSDSTLRGHFPLETDVIAQACGRRVDAVVLVPAFPDAGRITVSGTHYCLVNGNYVPVGESEFANDATFGYRESVLADWVKEKSGGAIGADRVVGIDLTTLRTDGEATRALLSGLAGGAVLTCDAVTEDDLRCLSLALLAEEAAGKHFVYRVGPPFVRARIGQQPRPPLSAEAVREARGSSRSEIPQVPGGLVVVGSHVGVTQRQLSHLKQNAPAVVLELQVSGVADATGYAEQVSELVNAAVDVLSHSMVILQTSRTLVTGADGDESLAISRAVSSAVVAVVQGIVRHVTPSFVLAKGGITSSDVASRGLEIRRAFVLGSMLPGLVSLWMAQDGPARGVPYIVFPGNVGDDTSLTDVVHRLLGRSAISSSGEQAAGSRNQPAPTQ